jgi:hypothetical protein
VLMVPENLESIKDILLEVYVNNIESNAWGGTISKMKKVVQNFGHAYTACI